MKPLASTSGSKTGAFTQTREMTQHSGQRALMLITTLTYGGAESQVVRLALELKALGWTVAVACMVPPSAHTAVLLDAHIPVHSLEMKRGIPDPRALFRLARLLRNFQPDIVHAHMVHANLLGRLVRLVHPIRVLICTAHNLRETSEKGGGTWHKELLYRITDPLAHRTTIICKAAFDRYVQTKAVPARRLQIIPNGVDTAVFAPSLAVRHRIRTSLALTNEFTWLAVGRLVEQKDYPNLLRALALLPAGNWSLLIAGKGPLEANLRALVAELGLVEHVRFIGTTNNMPDVFNAADAFVMSSSFEGLSAALLEAACTGLPAVVTDAGGNSDLVLDQRTGYVVPPQDSQALASAMKRLMSMAEPERLALGTAARQHCLDYYRFDKIARTWVRLYSRLLAIRPGTPALETYPQSVVAAGDSSAS